MSERRSDPDDRRLLGDLLLEAGIVTRKGLLAGLEEQRLRGGRLGYNLVKLGKATPAALHLFLQDALPVLTPDLWEALRRGPAVDLLPARLAYHYNMVPVRVDDGVLSLAISVVDTPRLIPAIEELTGLRVEPLICPPSIIGEALARFYPAEVEAGVIHRAVGDNLFILSDRRRGLRPPLPETLREDAPPADWLRAIGAEAIRRQARGMRIEPRREALRITFRVPRGDEPVMDLPKGAYLGLSALLEGLSRISTRGRVVPREGRLALGMEGRRLFASVLALPGLEGDSYVIDLRAGRVAARSAADLRAEVPGLAASLDRLAARGHGLLVVAGPGTAEAGEGLGTILSLLGSRLERRLAVGDWPDLPGLEILGEGYGGDEGGLPIEPLLEQSAGRSPDLLALADLGRPGVAAAAFAQGRDRVVVASIAAGDAFTAVERIVRGGLAPGAGEVEMPGILGLRLMEALCPACRRSCDLQDLLSPGPRSAGAGPGAYFAAQGCPSCRESGVLILEPVFEYLEAPADGTLFRPGSGAVALREAFARRGMTTLALAALRKAAAGAIDVREPLRLLLHEQR